MAGSTPDFNLLFHLSSFETPFMVNSYKVLTPVKTGVQEFLAD
jgi:hypothetical protein